MKKAWFVLPLLAGIAFAQGRVGPVGHGFGNVVFPGTGIPQQQPTGHIPALGAAVRGVWPGQPGGGGRPPQNRRPGGGPLVLPVPVYVGGYGYGYGGYDYQQQLPAQQPNITLVNAPQPSPSVIINQNYAPDRGQPAMHEYPANTELGAYQAPVPSHPEPVKPAAHNSDDDSPTIYLIALRDGTVYPAYAYWLEADTLHYITTKHSHNRTSLALVDERLSLQFNRERSVEFKLKGQPPAAAAKQ